MAMEIIMNSTTHLKTFNPQTSEEVEADFAAGKTAPSDQDHEVAVMSERFSGMGLDPKRFEEICQEAAKSQQA